MILSHKHRFIFIKTHKTASSSIETFLTQFCGPDDVVSPMDPPAEGHKPQNWIGSSPVDYLYKRYRRVRKIIHKDSIFLGSHYYQHMTAARIKKLRGSDVWNSYFKFCFDRNPWDKVVSFYWWKMREKEYAESFSEWLRYKKLPINYELYCIDNRTTVDFIGKYESLKQDLQFALSKIGIETNKSLPRVKTGVRQNSAHYSSYYNEEDKEFVGNLFENESALLGYEFENNT